MSSKKDGSRFLKGLRSYRASPKLTALAIEEFLLALDCPRALTVWLLFKEKEHEQLANLEFSPLHYNNSEELRDAYAATKFLSKFKGLTLNYDLDKVALEKFEKFEVSCKQTNNRFRNLSNDTLFKGDIVWLHNAIIRKIDKTLGDYQPEEIFSLPDWGPGASTLINRRNASASRKFQIETGITRDLYALIPHQLFVETYPHWADHLLVQRFPNFQVGNKVITVPKDASTNRVIAVEPGINLWFQKSFGEMIGTRLSRVGIDLKHQSRNQKLALSGSRTGELATVDLSSASDSISRAVVEELLPRKWYVALDSCRSHFGLLNGSWRKWEKFSSMGNGFTFQLESLIFYAAAYCCTEYLGADLSKVSVYGDDVIIPTSVFKLLSEVLNFYGFLVNEKKSHYDSPFRESCGAHYFSGFDVKPIYLKDSLTSILTIYRLANAIRRLAHSRLNQMGCDAKYRHVFELLISKVPKALRLRIPEKLGDGGFISNFDETSPVCARFIRTKQSTINTWIDGYRVRNAVERSIKYREDRFGYLLAEYWRISKRDEDSIFIESRPSVLEAIRQLVSSSDEISGRNTVPSHRTQIQLVNSTVIQWYDLGPWI